MNEMIDFLSLPDVSEMTSEVFVNDRIGKFVVRPMTVDEHSDYMKRCRTKINKKGMDFDSAKFYLLIVAGQTVSPNFSDAELLKKAGCTTATDLIKKKLLSGEIQDIADKICNISGFDNDIQEDIEEAKN